MDLSGKVAIITGASGGVGSETTKIFARAGAKVVLIDLNQDKLDELVSEIGLKEGEYLSIATDITKEEEIKHFVKKTHQEFGSIDILFNNAGIEGEIKPLVDSTVENLDNLHNVNVKGVFLGLKHVIPIMMEQKSGSIINTSSGIGLVGSPGQGQYSASKHAVIGLTKTAAIEVEDSGVRVNAICPAPVDTRMIKSIEEMASPDDPAAFRKQLIEMIPMKRYAQPEDIANMALFLGSDRSTFVHGTTHQVDGGLLA